MLPGDALFDAAGEFVAGVLFDAAGELVAGVLFEAEGITVDLIGADTDERADNVSWLLILFVKTVYKSTRPIKEMPRISDAFDIISSNVALPL